MSRSQGRRGARRSHRQSTTRWSQDQLGCWKSQFRGRRVHHCHGRRLHCALLSRRRSARLNCPSPPTILFLLAHRGRRSNSLLSGRQLSSVLSSRPQPRPLHVTSRPKRGCPAAATPLCKGVTSLGKECQNINERTKANAFKITVGVRRNVETGRVTRWRSPTTCTNTAAHCRVGHDSEASA
jgi:hypothetical protein